MRTSSIAVVVLVFKWRVLLDYIWLPFVCRADASNNFGKRNISFEKTEGREDVDSVNLPYNEYNPWPRRDLAAAVDKISDANTDASAASAASSWRFLLVADAHAMGKFSWFNYTINKERQVYSDVLEIVEYIYQNYGGELVVSPGDIVSYGGIKNSRLKELLGLEDEDISDEDAVYLAGSNAYSTTRKIFEEAGYDMLLATIGDHELGGNDPGFRINPVNTKLHTLPKARQAFGNGFYRNDNNGEFEFDNQLWFMGDDNVEPRPLGTTHENTSYAYVHKNALFLTVDAFETVEDGSYNFINREEGLGGEGAITCTLDGEHLEWFENVLRKGRDDPLIQHIIVQAHLPIIQPVQRVKCSGQFLDYGEQSTFWNLMNEYGVDLYLAGEVHANTATKTRHVGSDLIQIVSRGVGFNNFLSIDVSENILDVKIYNEIGDKIQFNAQYEESGHLYNEIGDKIQFNAENEESGLLYNEIGDKIQFNAQYEESGHLTIDKTTAVTQLSSSGMLKLLDLDGPILIYDFKEIVPLGTRQVLGFRSKTNLIATETLIRDKVCRESIFNIGQFGAQYDAQVCNVLLVEGRDGGYGGYFYGDHTRMAVFGTGPFSAGETISFGIWFKTWKSKQKMVILHHADYWGDANVSEEKDSFTLMLDHGIPVINTQPSRMVMSTDPKNLADGMWHHIAVSMPSKSCNLSELEIYIDGHPVGTRAIGDRSIFHTTSGRISFGGFGYSNSGFEDAYPDLQPYSGVLADIIFFSRPLNMKTDFPDFNVTPSPLSSVPSISCADNESIKFFWRMKNDGITARLKTCSWLRRQGRRLKKRICRNKKDPPAREVCRFTCGRCAVIE